MDTSACFTHERNEIKLCAFRVVVNRSETIYRIVFLGKKNKKNKKGKMQALGYPFMAYAFHV